MLRITAKFLYIALDKRVRAMRFFFKHDLIYHILVASYNIKPICFAINPLGLWSDAFEDDKNHPIILHTVDFSSCVF